MPDIHAMHRKMERFLGYNPDNEIRPDTVGALDSEVQESEWRMRNRQGVINYDKIKDKSENPQFLGICRVNFEKQIIKEFYYKHRGRK